MLETLRTQLKKSMLAKTQLRTSVLRMLITAVKNEAINFKKDDLSPEEFQTVVKRQVKQRKDSIKAFLNAGNEEAATGEKQELEMLEVYLPEMMSVEDLKIRVDKKKTELGINDRSGFGKLMGAVMKEVGNNADGTMVKDLVNQVLA